MDINYYIWWQSDWLIDDNSWILAGDYPQLINWLIKYSNLGDVYAVNNWMEINIFGTIWLIGWLLINVGDIDIDWLIYYL